MGGFGRMQEAAALEAERHERLEAVLQGHRRHNGKLHQAQRQRKVRLSQAQQEEKNELHETDEAAIRTPGPDPSVAPTPCAAPQPRLATARAATGV